MKLIACMPVRNEDWVLGLSLRVALMWCDEVVVFLHTCFDTSHSIARIAYHEHPQRIHFITNSNPQWDEMPQRQTMLKVARECGATHIAIVDADEVMAGDTNTGQVAPLRHSIYTLQPGQLLQLPLYNLRGGIDRYHSNGIWGNRIVSVAFADDPRLHWAGDTFHQREPQGMALQPYRPIQQGQGGVMHLWGASERRLIAKHALYKITERLRWPQKDVRKIDDLYSLAIKPREPWTFTDVPVEWLKPYEHLLFHRPPYLNLDAEPWQEAECRRLVAYHGREKFAGLDLFGVVK